MDRRLIGVEAVIAVEMLEEWGPNKVRRAQPIQRHYWIALMSRTLWFGGDPIKGFSTDAALLGYVRWMVDHPEPECYFRR